MACGTNPSENWKAASKQRANASVDLVELNMVD
jgi:hypothetical protein